MLSPKMQLLTTEELVKEGRKIQSTWNWQASTFCKKNGFDIKTADIGRLNEMMQTASLNRIADALEVLAFGEVRCNE